jgi:uncharacterized membrane protein
MNGRILRAYWDLVIVWMLIAFAFVHYFIAPNSLRMVLIAIFIAAIVPGHLIVQSIRRLRSLGTIERWALTLGASSSISMVVYLIEQIIWGRPSIASFGLGISVTCLVISVYLMMVRIKDPDIPRSSSITALSDLWFQVSTMRRRDRNLWIMAMAALVVIILVVAGLALQVNKEKFSEFYLLNKNGTAIGIPHNYTEGQPVDLIVGVANHEQRTVKYYVEMWLVNYTNVNMAVTVNEMYFAYGFNVTMISVDVDLNNPWTYQYEMPVQLNLTKVGKYSLFFLLYLDAEEALPVPQPLDPDTNYAQTSASWRVVETVNNSIQYLRLEVKISPAMPV